MLERDSLKILDEALSVLEQGFAAMPEFKATRDPAQQAVLQHDLQQLMLLPAKPGSELH